MWGLKDFDLIIIYNVLSWPFHKKGWVLASFQ